MFTDNDFRRLKRMGQIRTLSPGDFEWFGKFLLESLGYERVQVSEKRGEHDGDGGIDLIAWRGNERVYGECKRWKFGMRGTDILPIAIVRALGGCMLRDRVKRGVVITTLKADHRCISEGEKMGIGILGSEEIIAAMRRINPSFRGDKPGLLLRILQAIAGAFAFVFVDDDSAPKRRRHKR